MPRSQQTSLLAYLENLSNGFREAQLLFAANRLGVFSALSSGPLAADELAIKLECSERGLRILCDALVALKLLEKRDGQYEVNSEAQELLLPNNPGSYNAMLDHKALLYERWGQLFHVVKSGSAVADQSTQAALQSSPETFAEAMAVVGRLAAPEAVSALDLSKRRMLLDVGGGPGIYAIEFARRYPELRVVILDNIATLAVAKEKVHAAGLDGQVSFQPGNVLDMLRVPEFDFVFVSNVIHSLSFAENEKLVANCTRALLPGGQLCVKDFLLEESRTQPTQAALFAVNMLVNTDAGNCYTAAEVEEWMEKVKLQLFARISLTGPSGMVLGTKL